MTCDFLRVVIHQPTVLGNLVSDRQMGPFKHRSVPASLPFLPLLSAGWV